MLASPSSAFSQGTIWNQIDHELVRHKLSLISNEMQRKVVSKKRRVLSDARKTGNRGATDTKLLKMHKEVTDEWVSRVYQAYCETWAAQGQEKSAALIRAVFQSALIPLISTRQGAILSDFDLSARRTGEPNNATVKGELVRTLQRLRSEWENKLEVEAREWEHAKREGDAASTEVQRLDPDVWRSFHEGFRTLVEEELRRDPNNRHDRWLKAYVSYKEEEAGECGAWDIYGGVDEGFRARFDTEATRSGRCLDPTGAAIPRDRWLHHVFQNLLKQRSKLLFTATKEGGIITRVCEASAIFCSRLERKALESAPQSEREPLVQMTTAMEGPSLGPGPSEEVEAQAVKLPELDHRIELGKWADERLGEARRFTRLLRSGQKPQNLREMFPSLFSEVLDKLAEPKPTHFFQTAQQRRLTAIDLLNLVGDAKELSGYTLKDYRAIYNRSRKQAPKGE